MATMRSYLPSLASRKAQSHEGDYLKEPDAAAVSGSFTRCPFMHARKRIEHMWQCIYHSMAWVPCMHWEAKHSQVRLDKTTKQNKTSNGMKRKEEKKENITLLGM